MFVFMESIIRVKIKQKGTNSVYTFKNMLWNKKDELIRKVMLCHGSITFSLFYAGLVTFPSISYDGHVSSLRAFEANHNLYVPFALFHVLTVLLLPYNVNSSPVSL